MRMGPGSPTWGQLENSRDGLFRLAESEQSPERKRGEIVERQRESVGDGRDPDERGGDPISQEDASVGLTFPS